MLNEDRIKLMTKMAAYEEKEGKEMLPISRYFKSDYISFHIVKTAISATVAYCLILGMWLFYNTNYFMDNISKIDLVGLGKTLVIYYIIMLFVYIIIAYVFYRVKYSNAKRSIKRYYAQLKRISKLYEKEEYTAEKKESLGGKRNHDIFTGI